MTGTYDHLFVRHMVDCSDDLTNEGAAAGGERPSNISIPYGLMRAVDVEPSTVHMAFSWIGPCKDAVHWVNDHEHTYNEVLMWMGSNPDDVQDLGAELYLDIEGERHTVTTTGAVFIPAGIRHCPLGFNYVNRPFSFCALSLSGHYESDENMPSHT